MQYATNFLTDLQIPDQLFFPDELNALNVVRTWNAKEEAFPPGKEVLGATSTLSATTLEILLCAALAYGRGTTADRYVWRAVATDLGLLTPDTTLRLVGSTMRETRSPSEYFGDALAFLVLFKHYGIKHITRVGPFLEKQTASGTGAYQGKGLERAGDNKEQPDYFCLDRDGLVIIAEAKGASGPPSSLTSQLKHGVEQVERVNPVGCDLGPEPNRLVVGTNFPVAGKHAGNATTVVVDPDDASKAVDVKVTQEEIIRHSLANALSVSGLFPEAARLLQGQRQTSRFERLRALGHSVGLQDTIPLAPLFGDWWLTLAPGVWEAILYNDAGGYTDMRWPAYRETQNGVILPNGFGAARPKPDDRAVQRYFFVGDQMPPEPGKPQEPVELSPSVISERAGILTPQVLLPFAQARRRLSPGALLTQEELCYCWLQRSEVDLADAANRDLLVRSALRRPATLFLWLSRMERYDEVLANVLLTSPFDADRDVSDAGRHMLEAGALVLHDGDLEALVSGIEAVGYKHFREALEGWTDAVKQREGTKVRAHRARLGGRALKALSAPELEQGADDLARQLLGGDTERSTTSQLMDVGRALLLLKWSF